MAVASVFVGLFVGIFSGMLGIGGGTILVPVFKLGYMMESIACTATSLFTIIPTSASGAISHLRNKTCIPKLGLAAGIGGAITSSLGVWLATVSPDWAIMVAAAVIIGYSAFTMLSKAMKMKPAKTGAGGGAKGTSAVETGAKGAAGAKDASAVGAASASAATTGAVGAAAGASAASDAPSKAQSREVIPPVPHMGPRQLAVGFCIGLGAGVASGYVGVGGGFIMVPLMIQLLHTPMKLTSGTSLIAVMILAIPGVVYQALLGNVHWVAGIAVACGSIPGAVIGAKLIAYIPERTLRFIFGGFLFLVAIMLVLNQVGVV